MKFQPGDRVAHEGLAGTVARRALLGEASAWYVRWDTGNMGLVWAAELAHIKSCSYCDGNGWYEG